MLWFRAVAKTRQGTARRGGLMQASTSAKWIVSALCITGISLAEWGLYGSIRRNSPYEARDAKTLRSLAGDRRWYLGNHRGGSAHAQSILYLNLETDSEPPILTAKVNLTTLDFEYWTDTHDSGGHLTVENLLACMKTAGLDADSSLIQEESKELLAVVSRLAQGSRLDEAVHGLKHFTAQRVFGIPPVNLAWPGMVALGVGCIVAAWLIRRTQQRTRAAGGAAL